METDRKAIRTILNTHPIQKPNTTPKWDEETRKRSRANGRGEVQRIAKRQQLQQNIEQQDKIETWQTKY